MYNDKFALPGEKPIRSQSTSLPVAGLFSLTLPKPMSELPHIFGSSPLAFFHHFQNHKAVFALLFILNCVDKILNACSGWFCFYFSHLKLLFVCHYRIYRSLNPF